MKRKLFIAAALAGLFAQQVEAGEFPLSLRGKKRAPKKNLLREIPDAYVLKPEEKSEMADSTAPEPEFKPSFQVGSIVHMIGSYSQVGYPGSSPSLNGNADDWVKGAMLYRGRILVGGQLSKKGSFFLETELPFPIGSSGTNVGNKNSQAFIVMLDCQYEHVFKPWFTVVAGAQLVSGNRNGLQGAASLMANDFTFYQYAYNTFAYNAGHVLNSNYGRDIGVNFRGLLLNDKLEYRLGFFTGRYKNGNDPLRTVGRLVYNFLDADKSYYYSGTNLGKGKTISLGVGADMQATYLNVGPDVFVDVPLGPGSITFNGAFQYITGGTDTVSNYAFTKSIPTSYAQLGELGYYIKSLKIQPWLRYENYTVDADPTQAGATGAGLDVFNKTKSSTVFGGGINYFFNGYGTNLRLSYVTKTATTATPTTVFDPLTGTSTPTGDFDFTTKSYGQAWLQLQFFLF
jgi:hypothetical protein